MKIYFFLGKGGVGKSTLSVLTALYLAKKEQQVLLTSLDPAHNLSDIFKKDFSDHPAKVSNGLTVAEINLEKWIKSYLKKTEKQLTSSYSYLTSFSMEKHFSVMQHAPALEEFALHQAFSDITEKNKQKDFLIFDMPPTALALKFFALPQLSLIWLENLVSLRTEIMNRQKIITKLSLGQKTFERDRVMQNINNQQNYWQQIDDLLKKEERTAAVVVENPDQLSRMEAKRIFEKMKALKMVKGLKALNKSKDNIVKDYNLVVPETKNLSGLNELSALINTLDFSHLVNL